MSMEYRRPELEDVYREYFSPVYNYVFYRLLHREEAEDLVSQVFLKVASALPRYDPSKASVKTWIFRITDNALIDLYRKRKPSLSIDDENNGLENTLSVDFDSQYDSILSPRRKAVYRALTTLSERDRSLVYMKYFEDCTNREIARRLNMSEGTVGSILSRARDKLRGVLEDEI